MSTTLIEVVSSPVTVIAGKTIIKLAVIITTHISIISNLVHARFIFLVQELCTVRKQPLDILTRLGRCLGAIENTILLLEIEDLFMVYFSHMIEVTFVSYNKEHYVR